MFNQPSGGGFFSAKNAFGHLILIVEVLAEEQRPDNLRQGALQRVVTVNYADLDEPGQALHTRTLIGNAGITNRLVVGQTNVLGRIAQVASDKGQPAWVLDGYGKTRDPAGNIVDNPQLEQQDVARATQWVTAFTAGQIQQAAPPEQAQPQVPAQQYGAPQGQQYPAQQQQPAYGAPAAPQGYPGQQQPQQVQPQYAPQGIGAGPAVGGPAVPYATQQQVAPTVHEGAPDIAAVQHLLGQGGIGTQMVPQPGQQPTY